LKAKTIAKVLLRVAVSTLLVSIFFVLTQDIQIFPGVLRSWVSLGAGPRDSTPPHVSASFVTTTDGELLEVWHVATESDHGPVAVLFHGNGESVESTLHVQNWLRARNISSYSLDYRGYGRSSGWPSEQGIYRDVDAVLGLVSRENDLSKRPLILWGHSIGTGFAAYASTKLPSQALVLLSPYSNLRKVISEVPFFGFLSPFAWYEVPTSNFIGLTKSKCLIVLHGAHDTTILPSHSDRVVESAPQGARILRTIVQDAGHNDLLSKGIGALERSLLDCLGARDKLDQSPDTVL